MRRYLPTSLASNNKIVLNIKKKCLGEPIQPHDLQAASYQPRYHPFYPDAILEGLKDLIGLLGLELRGWSVTSDAFGTCLYVK